MSIQTIPKELFTYNNDESLAMMIYAIKSNHVCQDQRKTFNLCRSTPLGKFIEPEFCKNNAMEMIDCYLKVQRNKKCEKQFQKVFEITKQHQQNEESLNEYLKC